MNSDLYGNTYRIPEKIINLITAKLYTSKDSEGVKRAKNLIKNKYCTYQTLKRLKNFFDNFNRETQSIDQYELAGGQAMQNFVEQILQSERSRTGKSKEIKQGMGMIKTNDPANTAPNSVVRMTESEEKKELTLNAVTVMFDDEMRILLLKRSSYEDQWQPNKWNFIGGGIEDGESPVEGALREVREETGIEIDSDKIKEKFVIQRGDGNVEHVFIAKLPKGYKNDDVKLDRENDGYGWFKPTEIKDLDTVPNTMEYLRIAVEKYE